MSEVEVQALALKPTVKSAAGDDHADLVASGEFGCVQPDEWRSLDLGGFDAQKRVQRVEVQALPRLVPTFVLRRDTFMVAGPVTGVAETITGIGARRLGAPRGCRSNPASLGRRRRAQSMARKGACGHP